MITVVSEGIDLLRLTMLDKLHVCLTCPRVVVTLGAAVINLTAYLNLIVMRV